jgi:hypothetical protein
MINFLNKEYGASLRNCKNLVLVHSLLVGIFLFSCIEQIIAGRDITFAP